MMKGDEPTPENLAWTLACDECDGGGNADAQPAKFEARRFYVLPHDDPTGGIFYGRLDGEVLPVLQAHFTGKMRNELVAQLLTCATVADAVAACQERRAPTIFHGPAVLTGTQPGDDLGDETDDDDDDDDGASVTTESTTNASARAPTQPLQAAPPTAQAPHRRWASAPRRATYTSAPSLAAQAFTTVASTRRRRAWRTSTRASARTSFSAAATARRTTYFGCTRF